jgi:hypothetical protein
MKIELKLIINCPTLENLLEPFVHELWPWKFPFLPLLCRTYAIKVYISKLNEVLPWRLSTHPKAIDHLMIGHEWCLEVSKPPLSYVLKYG